jgi:hypothetical protein
MAHNALTGNDKGRHVIMMVVGKLPVMMMMAIIYLYLITVNIR